MTDYDRSEQIGLIHEALATFPIHVNGTLDETRPLPEWIQVLAMGAYELRELTGEIRAAREVSRARHKVVAAFLASPYGRFSSWLMRNLKTPILTVIGALLVYIVVHYFFPWLLPLAGLGV